MFAARCCRQWDRVTDRFAARAFNASLSVPALEIFGDGVSVSDYSNRLCPAGEGFPSTYGKRDCGMVPGQVGLLVGNTAAPVSYQIFHLFSATYFLGGPRPGLPRALNDTFGVPSYPRNTVSASDDSRSAWVPRLATDTMPLLRSSMCFGTTHSRRATAPPCRAPRSASGPATPGWAPDRTGPHSVGRRPHEFVVCCWRSNAFCCRWRHKRLRLLPRDLAPHCSRRGLRFLLL